MKVHFEKDGSSNEEDNPPNKNVFSPSQSNKSPRKRNSTPYPKMARRQDRDDSFESPYTASSLSSASNCEWSPFVSETSPSLRRPASTFKNATPTARGFSFFEDSASMFSPSSVHTFPVPGTSSSRSVVGRATPSIFASPPARTTGGGLFTSTTHPAEAGFSFGSARALANGGGASAGGLFESTTPAQGGYSFGSARAPANVGRPSAGGLFGSATGAQGGFSFESASTANGGGASTGGLFGSTTPAPSSGFSFGPTIGGTASVVGGPFGLPTDPSPSPAKAMNFSPCFSPYPRDRNTNHARTGTPYPPRRRQSSPMPQNPATSLSSKDEISRFPFTNFKSARDTSRNTFSFGSKSKPSSTPNNSLADFSPAGVSTMGANCGTAGSGFSCGSLQQKSVPSSSTGSSFDAASSKSTNSEANGKHITAITNISSHHRFKKINNSQFNLRVMVEGVLGHDLTTQIECANQFRHLTSIERGGRIQQVIDAGVVPRFVEFLQRDDNSALQLEAAWALTNIASGTSEHTKVVTQAGAVPIFVGLVLSSDAAIREQAIWALANVAGDSPPCRDLVLRSGFMRPLLQQLHPESTLSTLRHGTWALSNLCRGNPAPDFEMVKPALPKLSQLLSCQDAEVLADACWSLFYLSKGSSENTQAILETGVCKGLVELLTHQSSLVQTPALKTVINTTAGNHLQTQFVIDNDVLPSLYTLLSNQSKSIQREACWALSNIVDDKEHIQAVLDCNIAAPLIQLLMNEEPEIRNEAGRAISSATAFGSRQQVKFLVQQGCIPPLCDMLNANDPEVVQKVLEALENILKVGKEESTTAQNQWPVCISEADGLGKLEGLQEHPDHDTREKAAKLLQILNAENESKSIEDISGRMEEKNDIGSPAKPIKKTKVSTSPETQKLLQENRQKETADPGNKKRASTDQLSKPLQPETPAPMPTGDALQNEIKRCRAAERKLAQKDRTISNQAAILGVQKDQVEAQKVEIETLKTEIQKLQKELQSAQSNVRSADDDSKPEAALLPQCDGKKEASTGLNGVDEKADHIPRSSNATKRVHIVEKDVAKPVQIEETPQRKSRTVTNDKAIAEDANIEETPQRKSHVAKNIKYIAEDVKIDKTPRRSSRIAKNDNVGEDLQIEETPRRSSRIAKNNENAAEHIQIEETPRRSNRNNKAQTPHSMARRSQKRRN